MKKKRRKGKTAKKQVKRRKKKNAQALDVVCVGNATEDVFVNLHPQHAIRESKLIFDIGSKVDVDKMRYATGGGATNSAVALSRMGLKTGILCALGEDEPAKTILSELRKEKVSTGLVIKSKHYHTAYSVILTGFGKDRVILTYKGATQELNHEKLINWKLLKNARWLKLTSFHCKTHILKKILTFTQFNDIFVAFNPGQSELKQGLETLTPLLRKVHVLFLNAEEARQLTTVDSIRRNLVILQGMSPLVVITDGKNGVHAFDGFNFYFKKPYKVKVADTTGCGDAFNSGFLAGIIKGYTIEDSINLGMANSQSVIQFMGAKTVLLNEFQAKALLIKVEGLKAEVEKTQKF